LQKTNVECVSADLHHETIKGTFLLGSHVSDTSTGSLNFACIRLHTPADAMIERLEQALGEIISTSFSIKSIRYRLRVEYVRGPKSV
jgi:hypothetical protein